MTATAPPAADVPEIAVLPEGLRALLAAHPDRPVRLRDPATGRRWVLAPDPARPPLPPAATEAELDEIDRRLEGVDFSAAVTGTDAEAIRRGLAQADAGLCVPWDEARHEVRAELERRIRAKAGDR